MQLNIINYVITQIAYESKVQQITYLRLYNITIVRAACHKQRNKFLKFDFNITIQHILIH